MSASITQRSPRHTMRSQTALTTSAHCLLSHAERALTHGTEATSLLDQALSEIDAVCPLVIHRNRTTRIEEHDHGREPSEPWRLVLTTPSVPVYTTHRSKPAAYRAVQEEKESVAAGMSRVVRIAVEQWDVDAQTWVRYENVWDKTSDRLSTGT